MARRSTDARSSSGEGKGSGERSATSGPPEPWFSREQIRGAVPVVFVFGLAVAVLAGLAVLPARTWLSQRQNMAEAKAELEQIEADVEALEGELDLLTTEDEIERLARENFDLVYPGDESYRIIPADE